MDPWVTLQGVIDLFLLGAAGYCFLQLQKVEKNDLLRKEDSRRVKELSELRVALDNLVKDALEVSGKISKDIERKRILALEFSQKLAQEKGSISKTTEDLRSEFTRLKLELQDRLCSSSEDKYSEALRLADKGLSSLEISQKVNIPVGEIELVLSLRK